MIYLTIISFISKYSIELFKIFLTICLFFGGLYFSVVLKNYSENKRLGKLKLYFEDLVKYQAESAIIQAEHYKLAAKYAENYNERKVNIRKIIETPASSINAIDRQDLYNIYINNNSNKTRVQQYIRLISNIEYITVSIQKVSEENLSFSELLNKTFPLWDKYSIETNEEVKKIFKVRDLDYYIKSKDILTSELAKIWGIYVDYKGKMNLSIIYNKIIIPAINLIQQYPDNEDYNNLLTALSNWKNVSDNIFEYFKERKELCEENANGLIESANNLTKLISELKTVNTRNIFLI